MTLYEVQEALNHLQEQSGHNAEIVLGVVNDERLEERVQVILVVTGLGSSTLEEALSSVDKSRRLLPNSQPKADEISHALPAHQVSQPAQREPSRETLNTPNTPLTINAGDLDIPAFLRRAR